MTELVIVVNVEDFPGIRKDNSYYFNQAQTNDIESITENSIDEVRVVGFVPENDVMEQVFRVLVGKGKFGIEKGVATREAGQDVALDMKICGFTDVMSIKDATSGERFVVGQKPIFEINETAAIKLPPKPPVTDDDDLIDESALLDEDTSLKGGNSCGVDNSASGIPGKKRACKNCSCGLAELEAGQEAVKLNTLDEKINKASGCGGCAKGDAFRCANCPFLGKPAFEPGQERVILQMEDDF